MECSRTCMFGDRQLGWTGSYSFCLLGISRVAHICSEERLVLSVGEQVAVAGPAGLDTCSNELPAASSYPHPTGKVFCFELLPPLPRCIRDVNQSSGTRDRVIDQPDKCHVHGVGAPVSPKHLGPWYLELKDWGLGTSEGPIALGRRWGCGPKGGAVPPASLSLAPL